MPVTSEVIDETIVVFVQGPRIDAAHAVTFKDGLIAAGQVAGANLIVDLSCVDFVDSSGLGALVAALKQLRSHKKIALCALQRPVANLFKMTRMDRAFNVYSDLNAAKESF
jgi:anti-sigma B factor antagonist